MRTNKHWGIFLMCLVAHVGALSADDLPETQGIAQTNKLVTIKIIPASMDASIPPHIELLQPYVSLLQETGSTNNYVCVDLKIIIDNGSAWPYVFGTPYSLTGYDCLEFDMLLDDERVIHIKRRRPRHLFSKGDSDNIIVMPNCKWEQMISFDRRLWDFPNDLKLSSICKLRPRFAFGSYNVDGKYYRTLSELKSGQNKQRSFDDRSGELCGEWIDYWGNGE